MSQGKYIKDMLKKFGMDDSKAISTPMGTSGSLDSDASGNMVDQKMYFLSKHMCKLQSKLLAHM